MTKTKRVRWVAAPKIPCCPYCSTKQYKTRLAVALSGRAGTHYLNCHNCSGEWSMDGSVKVQPQEGK